MHWLQRKIFSSGKLLLLLFVAILFRCSITPLAYNGDVITQGEWSTWMGTHGVQHLFTNTVWVREWPNHPPLMTLLYFFDYQLHSFLMLFLASFGNFIAFHHLGASHLLWFFAFTRWFGDAYYPGTFWRIGLLLTIKVLPILADGVIALILYGLAKQQSGQTNALKYTALYLFMPFSWYLSALWGQSDQLAFVFLLLAFLVIFWRYEVLAPILFIISLDLKPTGIFYLPLLCYIAMRQKISPWQSIVGVVAGCALVYYTASLFANGSVLYFLFIILPYRLFGTKEPFTVVSAFNFWYIFHAKDLVSETTRYFLVPAKYWGYAAYAVVVGCSCALYKRDNYKTLFFSMFLVGFGSWFFVTNMYERYVFAGVVSLLFAAIYDQRLLKYWLILATIWLANLYNGWWFPDQLVAIKTSFLWHDRLLTRLLALVNGLLFSAVIWQQRVLFAIKKPRLFIGVRNKIMGDDFPFLPEKQ